MGYSVRQGDSLWVDFTLSNWSAIHSTWDSSWVGIFEISATETSTPLYTGSLIRSSASGLFQLRLNYDSASTSPALNWSDMAVGTYKLMTQFSNSTAKYREETHDRLIITTQGL
jgi:hypothetical protein